MMKAGAGVIHPLSSIGAVVQSPTEVHGEMSATAPTRVRIQVGAVSADEAAALKAAAASDRRSLASWSRLVLLDAAAGLGYRPAVPPPDITDRH